MGIARPAIRTVWRVV